MKRNVFFACAALLITLPAMAASFNCKQAKYPDEKAICASRTLNDMDVEMSVKYHFLHGLFAMGTAGDMKDAQDAWLAKRRQCKGNTQCLTNAYKSRLQELDKVYASIDKPL